MRIEEGALGQPLALAVIVQTGGQGAAHLRDYRNLGAVLDAVIGGVPHRVAVIAFDSKPRIEQDFTEDTDAAAEAIAALPRVIQGAAILDALNFGIRSAAAISRRLTAAPYCSLARPRTTAARPAWRMPFAQSRKQIPRYIASAFPPHRPP